MYMYLAKIYPPQLRNKYKLLMKYCDIDMNPEKFIGISILLGLVVSIIISVNLTIFFAYKTSTFFFMFILLFLVIQVITYFWLVLRADAKGRFVEDILPDALLLTSMNIKSGMTTDRALIMSARPEFGPLERELNRAGKKILAGNDINYALLDMTARIKSRLFDRTVRLIIEGIESGGELSSLLQQTADDIQTTKLVQNEVRSNVLMYAIFIFFAAGIGAPLLFGISTYLVSSIGTQFSFFDVTGFSNKTITMNLQVSPEFLAKFALVALTVTSFFGGLIIGIVKGGSEKSGLKFIPMLIIISFTIFFLVRSAVSSIFPVLT